MMKIIVFGSTGMLGNYVYKVLSEKYIVITITRKEFDIENDLWSKLDNLLEKEYNDVQAIINCAGVIPQNCTALDYRKYIRINTLFPHKLQELSVKYNYKFIHITTDCVYDGQKGNYIETDVHSETGIYGVSKSLGEPENACIIRTSIIGEELLNKKSLLAWLISQQNKSISGYTNYLWNGITCLSLAEIIKDIIDNNIYWVGVRHIFSSEKISKYELCAYINEIYNLNINIEPLEISSYKNMSLCSNNYIPLLFIKEQIVKQHKFDLKLGSYKILEVCRFCENKNIENIFVYSNSIPLAGGFLKNKKDCLYEKCYPLSFMYCNECKTSMIKEIIEPNYLFTQINSNGYFYYSSTILSIVNHFKNLSHIIRSRFTDKKNIMEIGCNDGVFLNNFIDEDYMLIGIDPSITINNISNSKIIKYNTFFNDEITETILAKHGKQDIIVACNCLAHIDNINSIYKNIKKLLHENGVIIIEVHYLKDLIDYLNFDFIYHEHMSYYTINTFITLCNKHDLYLDKIERIPNHGGSLRAYLKHKIDDKLFNEMIIQYIENENSLRHDLINFITKINLWKRDLLSIITEIKEQNIPIVAYGASGRTNMIISYLNISFDYIIDDSEEKINSLMPLSHILINSSNIIYTNNNITTIFILAWPYTKFIVNNHKQYLENGGVFIKVLPEIQEININNYTNFIN